MSGTDQLVWNLVDDQNLFSIWAIASLTEPLQDALVAKALRYLLQNLPILNARPVTNWFTGKWRFLHHENVSDLIFRVQATNDAEIEEHLQRVFNTPINAQDGAMIRLHSINGPGKHYFVIQIHHIIMDGESVKRICGKFAEIYRGLYQDPTWDPSQLLDSNRSIWQILRQASPFRLLMALPPYIITLLRELDPVQRQKNKIGYQLLSTSESASQSPLPAYLSSILIEEEIFLKAKKLTQNATHSKTTIHALLMTSLSLAAVEWNVKRGNGRNWLRLFHTANLRRWWGEPPATFANFSVVLQHDVNRSHLQTPAMALETTTDQLERTKKIIGIEAFLFTALLRVLPYALIRRLALRLKKSLVPLTQRSLIMTNIGIIPDKAGDYAHSKAKEFSLLAPTVDDGSLLFTISTYKNTLTIHLGCSKNILNKEDAQPFLQLWKKKFLEIITEE